MMNFGVAADLIAALVAFATVSLLSEEPPMEDHLYGPFSAMHKRTLNRTSRVGRPPV
ncbi:hypothetical protein MITS9509_01012 [Synechococcus sp. MIT S9509]|nr:hypothetical protein MITS9504_00575 [Synechococcus sp. MIT S9504]KZR92563.1 hypothetical protein MITS9509_01012 [Synechococcus sp. MIT S9509]